METKVKHQANPTEALKSVDCMVQNATEAIMAMAKAAKVMLAMDKLSLMSVSELLNQIDERCADVQNSVNYEAETCGASYIDEERTALIERLHAQDHALSSTTSRRA